MNLRERLDLDEKGDHTILPSFMDKNHAKQQKTPRGSHFQVHRTGSESQRTNFC